MKEAADERWYQEDIYLFSLTHALFQSDYFYSFFFVLFYLFLVSMHNPSFTAQSALRTNGKPTKTMEKGGRRVVPA